jgi:hypothetical protein
VSHTDLPPSVLWRNRQTESYAVSRPKSRNRHSHYETQTEKSSNMDLRLNQETHSPHLLVHGTDCTQCYPNSRSPDHWVPDVWLTISILCIRSPTHAMILVAARYVAPATCTPRDKQTRFSTRNKNKGKSIKMLWIWIQTSECQRLTTYQTKVLSTCFSISPLMSPLTTKSSPHKEAKREESMGLVKMSANYLSMLINFISISLFSTWSLRSGVSLWCVWLSRRNWVMG